VRFRRRPRNQNKDARDEADLLCRARALEEEALTQIYQQYHDDLYRYVYNRLGNTQLAQDLASEVFRRFLKALHGGKGPTRQVGSWLYRVAHNLIVDELRRRKYRNHQSLDEVLDETLSDAGQNLDEMVGHVIVRSRVGQALLELTADQREVLMLKFLEGKDNAQIAEILGKTVGAVKALQHRGLETLRQQLGVEEERVPVPSTPRPAVVLARS
jgi:RNA polymerase sigma-70 factor (ECF subfamily)